MLKKDLIVIYFYSIVIFSKKCVCMETITNKELRQEIIDAYFGYYDAYALRDWDTMVSFF